MTEQSSVQAHYESVWGVAARRLQLNRGPIEEVAPGFRVLEFQRSPDTVAYATCGMSTGVGLELHVLAPDATQAPAIVEVLTAVAHFHLSSSRLDLNHTVNFGRPIVAGASCSYGLVSLPYLDGPALEWGVGRRIRILWLLPITAEECAFKKAAGVEQLEARFESASFNYIDFFRASVV